MRRVLWFLCFLVVAYVLAQPAHAFKRGDDLHWTFQDNKATGAFKPSGAPLPAGPDLKPVPGGATLGGKKSLPWPGKSQAENMARWSAMASSRNMAKSMMSPASMIPFAAGSSFAWLMNQACVQIAGGRMELAEGGQWEECVMTRQPRPVYYFAFGAKTRHPSREEACRAQEDWMNSRENPSSYSYSYTYSGVTSTGSTNGYGACLLSLRTIPGGESMGQNSYAFSSVNEVGDVQTGWKPIASPSVQGKLEGHLNQACASGDPHCTQTLEDLLHGGAEVETDEPEVTGPPKTVKDVSTKTEEKTKTDPDTGEVTKTIVTTTVTTYNNYKYEGDTVTNTITTVTTTVNGNETSETTEETPEVPPDTSEAVDTAFPKHPELYKRKYPQGLTGLWAEKVDALKATPLFRLPAVLAPNLGDSGGCPVWNLSMNVGVRDWGTYNVSPPCFVWTFLRLCIIVGSLFLARALIFGG